MRRYLFAIVPVFVGSLACGGSAFTSPAEDGGPTGGQGGAGTTVSGTTNGTTNGTTVASTGPGSASTTGSTGGSSTGGSGGDGAGGSSGSGGSTGGSGGQVIDASRDARPDAPIGCDAIAPSPVTFHMTPQAGVNFCVNNCSTIWLSIFPAGGTTPLNVTRSCITTCDQCQPIACGATSRANPGLDSGAGAPADPVACIPPQPVKVEGETYTWSGVLWEPSKCGAFGYSCLNQVCGTPPGKYVARMCANRRTSDAGFCTYDPTPTCVDVPFDYPAAGVVEGTLR